jgi:hypothetical protein
MKKERRKQSNLPRKDDVELIVGVAPIRDEYGYILYSPTNKRLAEKLKETNDKLTTASNEIAVLRTQIDGLQAQLTTIQRLAVPGAILDRCLRMLESDRGLLRDGEDRLLPEERQN